MKKIFTLLCAAMMVAGVEAKLIFHESFDREVGTLSVGDYRDIAANTTDWWYTTSNTTYIQVVQNNLIYAGYQSTAAGKAIELTGSNCNRDVRAFNPITGGSAYFSVLINVGSVKQSTAKDYIFCLLDNGQYMSNSCFGQVKVTSNADKTKFKLGISKSGESYYRWAGEELDPNKTYLIVVRYDFIEGDYNDVASLWINPTKNSESKPTLVCVGDSLNAQGTSNLGSTSRADATSLNMMYIRPNTSQPLNMIVDEVKVATSWSDLFEEGGGQQEDDPVINAASSVEFGNVTVNEAAEKKLTVRGSNLKGAVSVVSSSEALVPAVSSIGKAAAEAGYELTLTLTATDEGEGSATITLSSEGAESKEVSVSWNAVAAPAETLTIAEAKLLEEKAEVALNDVVVVRRFQDGLAFSVQDETGALNIADYFGLGARWEEGDKISGLTGVILPIAEGLDGFCTIYPQTGTVIDNEVAIEPFAVSLSEFTQYGPALIKVEGVTFPEEPEQFAAGTITISQNAASANMQIEAGCDIIGEDVPARADVTGVVCHPYFTDNILIRSSADVSNRVPKGGDTPVYDNLLKNPSFEEYGTSFLGTSFYEWNFTHMPSANANKTDVLDGETSMMVNLTSQNTATLDQGVLLDDATYATGTQFELTINYKVEAMSEGKSLMLDCYWEAAAGGDSEAAKAHEADILQVALDNGSGWVQKKVVTSKPVKSSYFRVRVLIPKGAKVLFDDWSLYEKGAAPEEPFITVTPVQVSSVQTTLGNTVNFQTIHIKHGNVTSATTFYIGGKDAGQFQQSANELPADQSELDLIITYAPASAGTHEASLIFDNVNHTTILPNLISLRGSCTDPSAKPEITVTPSVLEDFEVLAGNRQEKTLTVSSVNCTGFVYARVDHIQGAAFTIDGTMAGKNYDATVTVTFAPQTAGSFQSTVTFYTAGGDDVVVNLNGVGLAPTPETVDWQTDFTWDESHPLAYMFEPFDNAEHNKTLLVNGWQNVADAEQRPWWGFDESKTSPVRGEEKYAKATAYKSGVESTGDWSMWLVTPALDYKNAETKVFAFKVMGEYLHDDQVAALEIYYVDPAQPTDDLRFQDLTAAFSIPKTGDENGQWVSFNLDLEPFAATVADVFHMAFKYVGPNGMDGAVTYYIDDVSWGKEQPMGIESVQSSDVSSQKILRNGQLIILRGDLQFNVLGIRIY